MNYQKLFDYLDQELGVIAFETQLSEIKEICREMIDKESEEDFEENWFPFGELDQETPELQPFCDCDINHSTEARYSGFCNCCLKKINPLKINL